MKTFEELYRFVLAYGDARVDCDRSRGAVSQAAFRKADDDLQNALRELIADAERWRYWRNLWPALTLMEVARFARLDLTRTYVDSPEKMDEVTDAARKG